jgi:hypothetical protein
VSHSFAVVSQVRIVAAAVVGAVAYEAIVAPDFNDAV